MKKNSFKFNIQNILILLVIIITTSTISIQTYIFYVSKPNIKIINIFWSDYTQVYENALNATLETYCNSDAGLMIQKHIDKEIHKLV